MGAKLVKSKSISEKTKEQQEKIITTVENANNHLNVTTNEDNKQTDKKNKKKKEKKLSKTKVDKSTNTEQYVLSSFSEQLVGDQISIVKNDISLNTNTAQVNAAYQPETPNKDVQELWNDRNGIISDGFHVVDNQQISNEQEYHANILNSAEESTNNGSDTVVANGNQIYNEKQQQQSVES
jgi:transposase